jgi:glutaredoxin 3
MAQILIYTTKLCPYCVAAKRLLKSKKASYEEIDVTFSPAKRQAMTKKAGGATSVPQIFIGETHIGGCDDLMELDQKGALDVMLQAG